MPTMNNTFNFTLERKKKENTTSIHKKNQKTQLSATWKPLSVSLGPAATSGAE